MNEVYDYISEELLHAASLEVAEQLKEKGRSDGGRKIEMRPYTFRIGTGKQIEVPSPYVKQADTGWSGKRATRS